MREGHAPTKLVGNPFQVPDHFLQQTLWVSFPPESALQFQHPGNDLIAQLFSQPFRKNLALLVEFQRALLQVLDSLQLGIDILAALLHHPPQRIDSNGPPLSPMLLGIGKVPAVIATVIYAVPPMIRLTDLGIRQVDPDLLEAARSFGATRMQLLLKVQVPLAMPTIMAGLNQTVMMALAMVVIASMIGARGLGIEVLNGINRLDFGRGLLGGIGIVIMAVVIDRISQGLVKDPMARDGAGEGEDAR